MSETVVTPSATRPAITSAAPPRRSGDFTWALHNYWLQYRYTMDKSYLTGREKHAFFDMLKGAFNVYVRNGGKRKKVKARVGGVVVNGVPYGTAVMPRVGAWAVKLTEAPGD